MNEKNIGLENHPEASNSGNRYFNYVTNPIPEEVVPHGDVRAPYQGPYDLTESDLVGLAVYASTLLNKDLLRYNPIVASQDALNMAIRSKDNGKFDSKLNDSTYSMVLAYLAAIQKPSIQVNNPIELRKANNELEGAMKKRSPAKSTITINPAKGPGKGVELSKDSLRKVLQGKPGHGIKYHVIKQLGLKEAQGEVMNKYAAITKQLDKIAGSLEETQDPELLRLALELDKVSDELDRSKEAAALESDKDEPYMKDHFKSGAPEIEKDEPYMNEFKTDKSMEVERIHDKPVAIRKASLPYQKV